MGHLRLGLDKPKENSYDCTILQNGLTFKIGSILRYIPFLENKPNSVGIDNNSTKKSRSIHSEKMRPF
jgi:hypothetical protein